MLDLRSHQRASLLASAYNMRFEKLLLSADEALNDAGIKTEKQRLIESSEQNESRRLLLVVEELSNKKKEVAANAESAYLEGVEAEFNKVLMADLDLVFKDTDMIIDKVLKFDKSLGVLLDVLYTESCSISRIITCLDSLPWLEASILSFTRQPKYKRLDSSGHPIVLKTIRNALSLVGIESLRILLPVLIAKHINPVASQSTPNIVKSMWLYTLGTGNVGRALASEYGVKPHFGYTAGLFANIGRTAMVSVYLRRFDKKLRDEIIKAREKNDMNQAQALNTLIPSRKFIIALWQRYAATISADVIKSLNCRWLMIAPGLTDFARISEPNIQHVDTLDVHPLAKLLFTSQGFMQYKMLSKERLIGKQEAMIYLRNFGLTSSHVNLITNINLTGIELNIGGTADKSDE